MSVGREWRVVQSTDDEHHLIWTHGEFVEKAAYNALAAELEILKAQNATLTSLVYKDGHSHFLTPAIQKIEESVVKLQQDELGQLRTANAELVEALKEIMALNSLDACMNAIAIAKPVLAKHGGGKNE